MKIDIEKNLTRKFNFDFEININCILQKVPPEHILGLHKIQVVHYSPEKSKRNAYGFYYGQSEGEKLPKIVLCAGNIFQNLPKALLRLSFIPRLFLARTIFHEIAHHYQRLQHGISKHIWEKDAARYTKKMMNRYFKFQLFLLKILFGPLFLIGKLTNKKVKQKQ